MKVTKYRLLRALVEPPAALVVLALDFFLAGDLDAAYVDTLFHRTGGHPLFVTELARLAGAGDTGLPGAVTEAVARLKGLIEPQRMTDI